jgi:hypothetical protein
MELLPQLLDTAHGIGLFRTSTKNLTNQKSMESCDSMLKSMFVKPKRKNRKWEIFEIILYLLIYFFFKAGSGAKCILFMVTVD